MTNENKSDFKSYYPRINVTDYLSERAVCGWAFLASLIIH